MVKNSGSMVECDVLRLCMTLLQGVLLTFPQVIHNTDALFRSVEFLYFWGSPVGIKPANLQSPSMNMPSYGFSGLLMHPRKFSGFVLCKPAKPARNLQSSCIIVLLR